MFALGGLLTCAAILILAAVAPVFRRADPPRWATYRWVSEFVTLAIVCMLALGLGYLGAGAIHAVQSGLDYLDLGLLAGVVLVAIFAGRKLAARARASAVETEAGMAGGAVVSPQAHRERPPAPAEPAPAREPAPPPKAA